MSDIPQGLAYIVNGLKARGHDIQLTPRLMDNEIVAWQINYSVPEFSLMTEYPLRDFEEPDQGLWDMRIEAFSEQLEMLDEKHLTHHEWQVSDAEIARYKDVKNIPHLQANRLIRDIEALYNVKFGAEGIAVVHQHYEQVYRHFWKLIEKAELK